MMYELEKFSPAEAEQVTSLSLSMQRDWRRRGFLPSAGGKVASFDLFDLARLLFLKLMSDRGVGPGDIVGTAILNISARRIAYDALTNGAAYGKHYPSSNSLRAFMLARTSYDEIQADGGADDPELWMRGRLKIAAQNDDLAVRIAYNGVPKLIPGPLFLWFADGEACWDEAAGGRLTKELAGPGADGAILMMVLPKIGKMLVERAGRPLVKLKPADGEG